MSKFNTWIVAAGIMFVSSAALAAAPQASRTVSVRAGQGDVVAVFVPSQSQREAQPYQLTGRDTPAERKAVTYRTGQGGLVQLPQR